MRLAYVLADRLGHPYPEQMCESMSATTMLRWALYLSGDQPKKQRITSAEAFARAMGVPWP